MRRILLSILLVIILASPCMASKLYLLCQGRPFDTGTTPYGGYVRIGNDFNGWTMYQIAGTTAQLTAIKALTGVVGIAIVTENGATYRPELNTVIQASDLLHINAWLLAQTKPQALMNVTYGAALAAIMALVTPGGIGDFNVMDFN
jgi:hypothetical protein